MSRPLLGLVLYVSYSLVFDTDSETAAMSSSPLKVLFLQHPAVLT